MKQERRWLMDALDAILLPSITQQGFERLPLAGSSKRSPEMRAHFPHGRFRRRIDKRTEIFDIQLADYSEPKFCINFANAPDEGVTWPHVHIAQADLWASETKDWYVLLDSPRPSRFFGVRRWFWQPPRTREQFIVLVQTVSGYLPEIGSTLATGKRGPHVRRYDVR